MDVCQRALHILSLISLDRTPYGDYCSHFIKEQTEAQQRLVAGRRRAYGFLMPQENADESEGHPRPGRMGVEVLKVGGGQR